MALYLRLPDAIDQHALNHHRWEELLASDELKSYEPNRVETDRHGHVVMSPWASVRHGQLQGRNVFILQSLLPEGVAITECPVSTSDGVKLVDAAWMSRGRFEPMREFSCFELAPEICVEVISPSNTRAETEERRALLFEVGCLEFWTVSQAGSTRFFTPEGELEGSGLCPGFPRQIDI